MNAVPRLVLACALAVLVLIQPLAAQITTGSVSGQVTDPGGALVPGATVTLVDEARGTRAPAVPTNATGVFVAANVPPGVYTLEIVKDHFKTLQRTGLAVANGDRLNLGSLTLTVGGMSEVVSVTAAGNGILASTGERSFVVTPAAVASLPIANRNFANLTSLAPGVIGTNRLGGGGQNNLTMDGVSAMDTGTNSQMLPLNVEPIAQVSVMTSNYAAELGRSSGLQVLAVTKAGTTRFRGSLYDIQRDSSWNENSWANSKNGDPKPVNKEKDFGYSIGGPIGKPGRDNKLFFFYSHEFRPRTTAGNTNTFRVPTALERAGDFSKSFGSNGLPVFIKDPSLSLPCGSNDTRGCFQDNGLVNRIPASRLYQPGLNLLSMYPLPNLPLDAGSTFNLESVTPAVSTLTQQPVVRVDYQASPRLRLTGRYAGQIGRRVVTPGSLPGFNDTYTPYPFIRTLSASMDYVWNDTTFLEVTYGTAQNQLGALPYNGASDRVTAGVADFPQIYPDAGVVRADLYQSRVLRDGSYPFFDGTQVTLSPAVSWGRLATPSSPSYPGVLSITHTQDVAASVTKVASRHTFKVGFYSNHSYRALNLTSLFQPSVNFGFEQAPGAPYDTTFAFANAAIGVFSAYAQAPAVAEGSFLYNNLEFYLQDNWKATSRLTLDYGLRITHQQPQYDQFLQSSNFFADRWDPAAAPVLYVPACIDGTVCSPTAPHNAMDLRTRQVLSVPGTANSNAWIGTIVPGSGNLTNGLVRAGDGISKYGYTWPALVYAPRFGMAYDLTAARTLVARGGVGLFYDRPDGNSVGALSVNPPSAAARVLNIGLLQDIANVASQATPPTLAAFQYDAKVPSSVQWNAGIQMALPWASTVDLAYVGQHGFNMLAGQQGSNAVDLNAPDFGTAFLPQYQNPSLPPDPAALPGTNALPTNFLRPYQGYGAINGQFTRFFQTFHSIQTSFNRRFRDHVQFGVNYTLSLQFVGNTGLGLRLQHSGDGTYSIRDDQAAFERLNRNLNLQRHVAKASFVWDFPDLPWRGGAAVRALAAVINDWQLAGVFTAGSGSRYDLAFGYQAAGAPILLTGTPATGPAYQPKVVYVADPGSGCSNDQFRQFTASAVNGADYHSVGLESGRNVLVGCPDKTLDLSLARNVPIHGTQRVQIRLDAFNALNTVVYNNRSTVAQFASPTNQTLINSETQPDGTINPQRTTPRTAGFGAATSAQAMRSLQLQVRFEF